MRVAFVGGRIFDGTDTGPKDGLCLIVEDDNILDIVQGAENVGDAHVVDVGGALIMPGLIDVHIHFAMWAMDLIAHQNSSLAYLCSETVYNLDYALRGGCTAGRDLGGLDAGFRDAITKGLIPVPTCRPA